MSQPPRKKQKTGRYRRWALTFFKLPDFPEDPSIMRYFIAGKETCPKTGKVHYQSYIELNKAMRLNGLKQLLNDNTVHCEACKGSAEQNITYCKKENDIYREFGTPSSQGQRNDLHSVRDAIKDGSKLIDLVEDNVHVVPVARYPRFVNTLLNLYSKPRDTATELYIYWGAPGTGKSRRAYAESGDSYYFKTVGDNWWDDYHQQSYVIIDDFRGQLSMDFLLRLCDRYPMRVPFKGGFANFNSKRVYITSNLPFIEWFNSEQKGYSTSLKALQRRITKCVHFKWGNPTDSTCQGALIKWMPSVGKFSIQRTESDKYEITHNSLWD